MTAISHSSGNEPCTHPTPFCLQNSRRKEPKISLSLQAVLVALFISGSASATEYYWSNPFTSHLRFPNPAAYCAWLVRDAPQPWWFIFTEPYNGQLAAQCRRPLYENERGGTYRDTGYPIYRVGDSCPTGTQYDQPPANAWTRTRATAHPTLRLPHPSRSPAHYPTTRARRRKTPASATPSILPRATSSSWKPTISPPAPRPWLSNAATTAQTGFGATTFPVACASLPIASSQWPCIMVGNWSSPFQVVTSSHAIPTRACWKRRETAGNICPLTTSDWSSTTTEDCLGKRPPP